MFYVPSSSDKVSSSVIIYHVMKVSSFVILCLRVLYSLSRKIVNEKMLNKWQSNCHGHDGCRDTNTRVYSRMQQKSFVVSIRSFLFLFFVFFLLVDAMRFLSLCYLFNRYYVSSFSCRKLLYGTNVAEDGDPPP